MPANKSITDLDALANSGGAVYIETVRDGGNFKFLCNLQATAAPTVTNDSSQGYMVGSIWNFGGVIYTATDVSVGAAVWTSNSGKLTITPVITAGAGASSEDWTFMWTRQGNNITAHFLCRDVTIPSGVTTVTMTLELDSTEIAPSSNFTGAFNFTGNGTANSLNQAAGVVSSASINTVNASKKLQFSIGLTAAASGDYNTSVGGSIEFEIVPS